MLPVRHCRLPALGLALACLAAAGCRTPDAGPPSPAPPAAAHYLDFADAQALATYLRADSEAGPLVSAHRGGPGPGFPENALETFDHALRFAPVLIECDVRASRDSVLVLMHDETLDRTTTGSGAVAATPFARLRTLLLRDERGTVTGFHIPTLDETMAWAEGRAILTLDVKPEVPPARIVEAVRRHRAGDRIVVIVYTLADLRRYYRLAPDLVYSASVETADDVRALLASGVDPARLIVFTGVGEVKPDVIALLHAAQIRAMLGTFGPLDDQARTTGPAVFEALIAQGIDVVATDVVPVAAQAVGSGVPAAP